MEKSKIPWHFKLADWICRILKHWLWKFIISTTKWMIFSSSSSSSPLEWITNIFSMICCGFIHIIFNSMRFVSFFLCSCCYWAEGWKTLCCIRMDEFPLKLCHLDFNYFIHENFLFKLWMNWKCVCLYDENENRFMISKNNEICSFD